MNKRVLLTLMLSICVEQALAQVESVTLKNDGEPVRIQNTRWPFQGPNSPPYKGNYSDLVSFKKNEADGKYDKCANGGVLLSKYSQISGWILKTELYCARNAMPEKTRVTALSSALMRARKSSALQEGPWRQALMKEYIQAELEHAKLLVRGNRTEAWQGVNRVLAKADLADKEDLAKAYLLASELAYLEQKLEAAHAFVRQSLDKKATPEAQEKLKSIENVMAIAPAETKAQVSADLESEEEQALFKRVISSLKGDETLAGIKDGVQFLNRFPGSKKAQNLNDQLLETYLRLVERVDSGNASLLATKNRARALLMGAHPHRVFEWMRTLHRRADFEGALVCADTVASTYANSPQSTLFHFIAGRSAHFVGSYSRAKSHYRELIENNFGTPESHEASLRLGLIYMRESNWGAAAAVFEKLILLPGSEKYELQARYWLIRAWQKQNSPRVAGEIENLLAKFPLSYYGLVLRAEQSSGELVWTYLPQPKLQSQLWMTAEQKKSWQRMQLLAQAGWFDEAQFEAREVYVPPSSDSKVLLSIEFAKAMSYLQVVRLISDAGDEKPDLRHLEFIRVAFPKEFQSAVEAEAKENKISPVLSWSLIRQESAYNWRAVSSSNAYGLMQLIGPTALEVSKELKLPAPTPEDLFKTDFNVKLGTKYVRNMLNIFGNNVPMALGAYNAGPTRMLKWVKMRSDLNELQTRHSSQWVDEIWFDEVPWQETSFYIKAILRNTLIYRMLGESRVEVGTVVWKPMLEM